MAALEQDKKREEDLTQKRGCCKGGSRAIFPSQYLSDFCAVAQRRGGYE